MSFALLKLSYNKPGDVSLTGGICGTGFFVDNHTAITANHVLNDTTFNPNEGFSYACVWILTRNGHILPLLKGNVELFPEIDTTIIRTSKVVPDIEIDELNLERIGSNILVWGIGHCGNSIPQIKVGWEKHYLWISDCCLDSVLYDKEGKVIRHCTMNINAADVKMHNVEGFELSFGSRVGMSGGPVICKETKKVIGMLSMGLPQDSDVKSRTFGVSIDEIKKYI